MNRQIKHQFTFSNAPEEVWKYLTDQELLALWLMPNDFKPVVGHHFRFKARPKLKLRFNGDIYCEVLEVIPHRKLVYSWKGGMSEESPSLDSVVIWTLKPSPTGGTILTLEHKGFNGLKNYIAYLIMDIGWSKIGKRLVELTNKRV